MSFIVNKDTYIGITDADQYVQENYAYNADVVTKWSSLTTPQKESLLRSSTAAIDHAFIPRGWPCQRSQYLKFPRVDNEFCGGQLGMGVPNQLYDTTFMAFEYSDRRNGLKEAREATVENAIAAMLYTKTAQQAQTNGIIGITSQKIGSIAETYSASQKIESVAAQYGIYAYHKVCRILRDWITGNVMTL